MANPFCLIGTHLTAFQNALRSGQLDPIRLQNMDSATRHAEFAKVVGEKNAAPLNAAFESKLLLKNQQAGLIRWIQQSTTPGSPLQRELLARVDRMDQRILNPASLRDFYADLAKQKLGFGVTMQEAGQITQLAQDVANAKAAMATGGNRLDYGRAKYDFGKYVSDLKNAVPQERTVGGTITDVAGVTKSIRATADNSALFRQGWKTLFTNPGVWAKNAAQSFANLAKEFGGKPVMRETMAEIQSRDNAVNGRQQKGKLAIGNTEEEFPTSLPEKIPGIGRIFKASESAYKSFLYKTRADVFDKYIDIAQKSGLDVDDKVQLEAIGELVNSLTGRGSLHRTLEPSSRAMNNIFFSPRKIAADWNTLTAHSFDSKATAFTRKQAAVNLVKVVSGSAAILAIADAVAPGSVEWDPRSADFGTIKVGNTRFDVTGGMRSMLTLAARSALVAKNIVTDKQTPVIKSSTTGKFSDVNTGKFGARTGGDIVYDFFANKASPAATVVRDVWNQRTFAGDKPTVGGEIANLLVPLPITNAYELAKDPKTTDATVVAAIIADALGVSTNTYGAKKKPVPKKKAPAKKP